MSNEQIYIQFFKNHGFSIGNTLLPKENYEFYNSENFTEQEIFKLKTSLKNNFFYFANLTQANTSFYLITTNLNEKELFEIKKFIWNENKFDLLFYPISKNQIKLQYARTNIRETKFDSEIKIFEADKEYQELKNYQFNSGTFWYNYKDFIDKLKKQKNQTVDLKLAETLSSLRERLKKCLKNIVDNSILEINVQALIDRTLFIKFLEDNHIINSAFYNFYFGENINYKTLLQKTNKSELNRLFDIINKTFNNRLFDKPQIDEYVLNNEVTEEIKHFIEQRNPKDKQLSLFDFRFDVIPIEFISHIYENSFSDFDKKKYGAYYTPEGLAKLLIDNVITENCRVLDPACGSGIFLVLAFRKILKFNNLDKFNGTYSIKEFIKKRNQLLIKYIFGIEKNPIAQRFAVFSLYLELIKDIPSLELKSYITKNLNPEPLRLFSNFDKNIIPANSLQTIETENEKIPFKNETFDVIVGNPPFHSITEENEEAELEFWKTKFIEIETGRIEVKKIVGDKQMSQCFMLKIKEWAKPDTKFAFVQNYSNFENENSQSFESFFVENYTISRFYELSKIKDILFTAGERVCAVIFSNTLPQNNNIEYFSPELTDFSKAFRTVIMNEEDKIIINQQDLINKNERIRDYLVGNKWDWQLIKFLDNNEKLENFLLKDKNYDSFRGLQIVGFEAIMREFDLTKEEYKKLSDNELANIKDNFINKYTNNKFIKDKFEIPCLSTKNIEKYKYNKKNCLYLPNYKHIVGKYERWKNNFIYQGNKILINRLYNKINAFCTNEFIYFDTDVYVIKLNLSLYGSSDMVYHLFIAILNSDLVSYYTTISKLKRANSSFQKKDVRGIKAIPIPSLDDENLVKRISELSKKISDGVESYEDEKIKNKLNNWIYELYNLDVIKRKRINDFFAPKINVIDADLIKYCEMLKLVLRNYINPNLKPSYEYLTTDRLIDKFAGVSIYFDSDIKDKNPQIKSAIRFKIEKLFEKDVNFQTMKNIIFGENCIYIVKEKSLKNWTETAAYEDGNFIISKLRN